MSTFMLRTCTCVHVVGFPMMTNYGRELSLDATLIDIDGESFKAITKDDKFS